MNTFEKDVKHIGCNFCFFTSKLVFLNDATDDDKTRLFLKIEIIARK